MPHVLEYWVLELELEPEQDLSPASLLRVGEDPTLIVLGFDNEHAEPRNEDMINLGCAVLHLKRDVIHQVIVRRTEVHPRDAGHQRLATILEYGGAGGAGGAVTANDEANGNCNCKENVENGPVALLQVKEKLR